MLVEAQSDNGTRIYFRAESIDALGVHQANPLWSWVQIRGEEYRVHTTIDELLRQIPEGR